jgi:hypothetical protein
MAGKDPDGKLLHKKAWTTPNTGDLLSSPAPPWPPRHDLHQARIGLDLERHDMETPDRPLPGDLLAQEARDSRGLHRSDNNERLLLSRGDVPKLILKWKQQQLSVLDELAILNTIQQQHHQQQLRAKQQLAVLAKLIVTGQQLKLSKQQQQQLRRVIELQQRKLIEFQQLPVLQFQQLQLTKLKQLQLIAVEFELQLVESVKLQQFELPVIQ